MLGQSRGTRSCASRPLALGCLVAVGTWLAPAAGRACSGPFYDGPDTIPRVDARNVPVNALIQVAVDGRAESTLDVELSIGGEAGTTLTLARHPDRPYFVGAPESALQADTLYEVRVPRATYCSWVPPGYITNDCNGDALNDGPVALTSFQTGSLVDVTSPTIGEGQAVFSFSELVRIEGSSCAGGPRGTYLSVRADDTGWVASDDGGIAGYFLVHEGVQGNELHPTPFPSRAMRCSGEVGEVGVPGSYQVVAMDYAGNVSMLSAASTVPDGCPSSPACAAAPAVQRASPVPRLLALAGVSLLLLTRRRTARLV